MKFHRQPYSCVACLSCNMTYKQIEFQSFFSPIFYLIGFHLILLTFSLKHVRTSLDYGEEVHWSRI